MRFTLRDVNLAWASWSTAREPALHSKSTIAPRRRCTRLLATRKVMTSPGAIMRMGAALVEAME